MRSSTTFIVFGGLVLVLLLFTVISQFSTAQQPSVRVSNKFLHALATQDSATILKLLDTTTAKPSLAGTKLTGISFTEVVPYDSAFARRPATKWTYLQLAALQAEADTSPVIAGTLATIEMKGGAKLHLHQVDGAWKVFYISHAEDEKK